MMKNENNMPSMVQKLVENIPFLSRMQGRLCMQKTGMFISFGLG
jgi:hypothetical protein